ncbi:unnamed protein product [Rhizophagus irregularis]|nr:unnamed protein product [Rhizophagus irregularis]CAB5394668.1 unnamed protein product [Rhizophagus irregularis]
MSTSTSSTQKKKVLAPGHILHWYFIDAFRGSRYLSALRSRGYVPYSHVFMKYWEKLLLSGGFTAKYDMAILVTSDKVRGLTSLVLPVYIGHTMFCDGVRSNRVIVLCCPIDVCILYGNKDDTIHSFILFISERVTRLVRVIS